MSNTREIQNFDEFKKELISNPTLQQQFKENPAGAIEQFQQKNPLKTDVWIYRIIISSLSFVVVSIILGVLYLITIDKVSTDKNVPTILTAMGSAAIGALAGLLAPQPSKKPT